MADQPKVSPAFKNTEIKHPVKRGGIPQQPESDRISRDVADKDQARALKNDHTIRFHRHLRMAIAPECPPERCRIAEIADVALPNCAEPPHNLCIKPDPGHEEKRVTIPSGQIKSHLPPLAQNLPQVLRAASYIEVLRKEVLGSGCHDKYWAPFQTLYSGTMDPSCRLAEGPVATCDDQCIGPRLGCRPGIFEAIPPSPCFLDRYPAAVSSK